MPMLMEEGRRKKLNIKEIRTRQGDIITSSQNIREEAVNVFREQFTETQEATEFSMLQCIPKIITDNQNYEMERASNKDELWRQFANFAGLRMQGMHLQQLIIEWWKFNTSPQLQRVMKAIPTIIMWTIWKRRNNIKHGGNTTLSGMVVQVQDMVRKLVKTLYPWIHLESNLWPDIVMKLKWYTPKLHYNSVPWKPPDTHRLKCNTDGGIQRESRTQFLWLLSEEFTCKFNLCKTSRIGYYYQHRGRGSGNTRNIEVLLGEQAARSNNQNRLIVSDEDDKRDLEDTLDLAERGEIIRKRLQQLNANIIHIFREGNNVADLLANLVVESQQRKEYNNFEELPTNIRRHINIDKAQIPTLRIRTRKINIQH
ncbi:hypothetical protein H5410_049872 [Solanum commersonii]|uniref:RNase H family protein n=1 Tax=Solanum commersonii TaxID=4109 RepID=A0A9J5WVE3_SOLCO|nr:hypothetical protein H5410_049872 [Solanum commersonii]